MQQATNPNAHQTLILHGCDLNDLNRHGRTRFLFFSLNFLFQGFSISSFLVPNFANFWGKFDMTLVGMPMHDD
jgi:hypothetical protein